MNIIQRSVLLIAAFLTLIATIAVANESFKIETIRAGSGEIAIIGQQVSVHYEGKLADGTVFDASRPRGQPFSFTLGQGQVIEGWEKGVEGMSVGEIRRLTIPPELGYGLRGLAA